MVGIPLFASERGQGVRSTALSLVLRARESTLWLFRVRATPGSPVKRPTVRYGSSDALTKSLSACFIWLENGLDVSE